MPDFFSFFAYSREKGKERSRHHVPNFFPRKPGHFAPALPKSQDTLFEGGGQLIFASAVDNFLMDAASSYIVACPYQLLCGSYRLARPALRKLFRSLFHITESSFRENSFSFPRSSTCGEVVHQHTWPSGLSVPRRGGRGHKERDLLFLFVCPEYPAACCGDEW